MISPGLRVKVHYRGTLDDGTEFDNSYQRGGPIEFVMGKHTMLPAFEYAVSTLSEGTSCNIHIPAVDAYGFYKEDLIDEVPIESIEHPERLPIDQIIQMRGEDGKLIRAKVLKISDGSVFLDYNHPLAGQALNFKIELLEVERKTAIEQEKMGQPCRCHEVRTLLTSQSHTQHQHDNSCNCAG